jgi:putative transposase
MPNYRRALQPGGTFFLTLVTHGRRRLFDQSLARSHLRRAIAAARADRPFELVAIVLLPDHLHLILTLPIGDADFSVRLSAIKARFTRTYLQAGGTETPQSVSREESRHRGVWQKRFWERLVRDENDLIGCIEYIHYNPVKHGLATCPHAWEWSSFEGYVRSERYPREWCCACDGSTVTTPRDIAGAEMD